MVAHVVVFQPASDEHLSAHCLVDVRAQLDTFVHWVVTTLSDGVHFVKYAVYRDLNSRASA